MSRLAPSQVISLLVGDEVLGTKPSAYLGQTLTIQVDLSCGTTNALVSIMEPEKCEYRFKVTTPALCWPLDKDTEGQSVSSPASAVKEEL